MLEYMEELNEIISDYLQAKDTDYAIMISGEWGCGKTYYLEHEFNDFIQKQTCPTEPDTAQSNKKAKAQMYSPAFISLYGISSPEDFHYRVFLGVNSWTKNKVAKALALMGTKLAGATGLNFDKSDTDNITFISNNTVLVFDDLERICSNKISVIEVLGLINEYSEHNHYKVIIVCNEEVYAGEVNGIDRNDDYWRYKEKTIRYTYRFNADIPKVYDTILRTYNNAEYSTYLEQNKSFILNMFLMGENRNLRTLKYYMDSMHKIFANTPNVKYKRQILRKLFVTTMIYTAEYKKGKEKNDLMELKATYNIDFDTTFLGHHKQEQKGEKQSYTEKVINIYGTLYNDDMEKLPFIIDYLITGHLTNQALSDWTNESNKDLENAELKPEYQLYRELSSFAMVDDNTLVDKLNHMINYAKEGKYTVVDLMNVYALLVKYHCFGIEGFSITEQVEQTFIEAIDKHKDGWNYIPALEYKIPMWDIREAGHESYDKYEVLKKHVIQMNYQRKLEDEKATYEEFLQKAENGDVKGIKHYRENNENTIYIGGIDWSRICNVLETGNNPIACEVANCLQFLIPNSSIVHPDDWDSLKNVLKPWLDEYAKKEDKRIRRMYILELKKHIESIIRSC